MRRRHKIAITIIAALAVTVGAVRLVAPELSDPQFLTEAKRREREKKEGK